MELNSVSAKVTLHYKDKVLEAITVYNGHPVMYSLTQHDQKLHDDFFEINHVKDAHI